MSTSPWAKAFLIESNVADIISRQSKHGFNFDRRRAQWYIHLLAEKIAKIDIILVPLLPKMINIGTSYKKVFLMNGSLSKYPKLHCDNHKIPYEWIGGQFTALHYTDFDTGKVAKIKDYMLSNGWIPTEWNTKKMPLQVWQYRKRLERNGYNKFYEGLSLEEKEFYDGLLNPYLEKHFKDKPVEYMKAILTGIGFPEKDKAPTFAQIKKRLLLNPFWPSTPKITEDSLESLSTGQSQTLTLLKERMLWSHRKSFLEGLILKLREDGKIEGQANPCATPTARMKHRIAVNIPSANAVFGKECRSLFIGDRDFSRKSGYLFKPKCTDPEFIVHGTNLYFELDKKGNKVYHRNRDFIPHGRQAIVGYDGSGLELRMLCHFMIKECQDMLREAQEEGNALKEERARRGLESALNYREVLLNGDIHTHNQHLAGLPTRAAAKSFNINGRL